MPEGHTIHRLARRHQSVLTGQALAVSSPQGRFVESAAVLDGRAVKRVEAYGKHLFYWWEPEGSDVLHVHLGLYGRFIEHPVPPPEPRGLKRLRMVGGTLAVDLSGPTACELLLAEDRDRIIARLGPDLLRADADSERAWQRISRSRVSIGALLMDQSVMAGVGNVYRAEALFVCGIAPDRQGRSLSREEFNPLWDTLRSMLRQGVKEGRIVTVDPAELGKTRRQMRKDDRFYVYKRDRCRRCSTPVRRHLIAGRTSHACPTCQVDDSSTTAAG